MYTDMCVYIYIYIYIHNDNIDNNDDNNNNNIVDPSVRHVGQDDNLARVQEYNVMTMTMTI